MALNKKIALSAAAAKAIAESNNIKNKRKKNVKNKNRKKR